MTSSETSLQERSISFDYEIEDAADLYRDEVLPEGVAEVDGNCGRVIPEEMEYVCLEGMSKVGRILRADATIPDRLVVLSEYNELVTSLMSGRLSDENQSVVVLGQPGIGKTLFLVYLLLYRLKRRLPTAIQLGGVQYVVFDGRGAVVCRPNEAECRLQRCWALADSNASVGQPCPAFLGGALRVIQATLPEASRWKHWAKQKMAMLHVMDLPGLMEVAAMVKESGCDPSEVPGYFSNWGPATRGIINALHDPENHLRSLESKARTAAGAICEEPSILRTLSHRQYPGALNSVSSDVLFMRPYRAHNPDGTVQVHRHELVAMVPTRRLKDILEDELRRMNNTRALEALRLQSSGRG
ncbi:unnamed protein product [Peniophora sp. CBMAI 1063]|nr:unnamed protein product [Peniophora sp. CBMAI 1063]